MCSHILLLLKSLRNPRKKQKNKQTTGSHADQAYRCAKGGDFLACTQHLRALLSEEERETEEPHYDQASVRLALAEVCLITKSYDDVLKYIPFDAALSEVIVAEHSCRYREGLFDYFPRRCEELKVEALVKNALSYGRTIDPKTATVCILPQYAIESLSLAQTLAKGRQLPASFFDPFLDALVANRTALTNITKDAQTSLPPSDLFRTDAEFRSVVRARRKEWYVALLGKFPLEYGLEIEARALYMFLAKPDLTEPNPNGMWQEEKAAEQTKEVEESKAPKVEQLLLRSLEPYSLLFMPHDNILSLFNDYLGLSMEASNMLLFTRAIVPKEIPRRAHAATLEVYKKNKTEFENLDDYTLHLTAAITLKQHDVVARLLAELKKRQDFDMSVLLNIDNAGYSPLTSVLDGGNVKLLKMMQKFIKFFANKRTKAKKMHDEDLLNVLFLLENPNFSETYWRPHTIFRKFLKPLFWDMAAIAEHFRLLGFKPLAEEDLGRPKTNTTSQAPAQERRKEGNKRRLDEVGRNDRANDKEFDAGFNAGFMKVSIEAMIAEAEATRETNHKDATNNATSEAAKNHKSERQYTPRPPREEDTMHQDQQGRNQRDNQSQTQGLCEQANQCTSPECGQQEHKGQPPRKKSKRGEG